MAKRWGRSLRNFVNPPQVEGQEVNPNYAQIAAPKPKITDNQIRDAQRDYGWLQGNEAGRYRKMSRDYREPMLRSPENIASRPDVYGEEMSNNAKRHAENLRQLIAQNPPADLRLNEHNKLSADEVMARGNPTPETTEDVTYTLGLMGVPPTPPPPKPLPSYKAQQDAEKREAAMEEAAIREEERRYDPEASRRREREALGESEDHVDLSDFEIEDEGVPDRILEADYNRRQPPRPEQPVGHSGAPDPHLRTFNIDEGGFHQPTRNEIPDPFRTDSEGSEGSVGSDNESIHFRSDNEDESELSDIGEEAEPLPRASTSARWQDQLNNNMLFNALDSAANLAREHRRGLGIAEGSDAENAGDDDEHAGTATCTTCRARRRF